MRAYVRAKAGGHEGEVADVPEERRLPEAGVKRLGWIIIGWTGRAREPYHDTTARTRTEAIRKWQNPLSHDGWPQYELLRRRDFVRAVRTYLTDAY